LVSTYMIEISSMPIVESHRSNAMQRNLTHLMDNIHL
jgi:hypothetical protein